MALDDDARCEADFYIGEWTLIQGDKDDASVLLQRAVDTCPKNFIEYSGAVAELRRLE